MAYDEVLGARIAALLGDDPAITAKRMFGGIAFMAREHMFVGIVKDDLMVRVGPEAHAAALKKPHARPMDFAGRPMTGYIYVDPEGTKTDRQLKAWIDQALGFVASLPEKEKKAKKPTEKSRTKTT